MATYASLTELKAYLGVTDNSKDTLLTMYLESAEKTINNFLQVDTIVSSTVSWLSVTSPRTTNGQACSDFGKPQYILAPIKEETLV